ncbi:MAG TPA: universal stress protein [Kofleriaceae bacterium]
MNTNKILCAVDFSPCSQQALRVAARLAKRSDAELVIAHAWQLPAIGFEGDFVFPVMVRDQLVEDTKRGLEAAVHEVADLGVQRVSAQALNGVPWHEVVKLLEDPTYQLVVIGTHGRTGLSRVLIGSVAEKIVRHAPCSVLVVRPDGEPQTFKHVLCPVDFSASARQAFELAAELARAERAEVTLLHVLELPVPYSGEPFSAEFARDLDQRSARLLDKWAGEMASTSSVPIKTRTRIGWAGAETLAVLDADRSIDLVVLGSHGRTGIKRILLGSVAEKIMRHARCPVLISRRRGSDD